MFYIFDFIKWEYKRMWDRMRIINSLIYNKIEMKSMHAHVMAVFKRHINQLNALIQFAYILVDL